MYIPNGVTVGGSMSKLKIFCKWIGVEQMHILLQSLLAPLWIPIHLASATGPIFQTNSLWSWFWCQFYQCVCVITGGCGAQVTRNGHLTHICAEQVCLLSFYYGETCQMTDLWVTDVTCRMHRRHLINPKRHKICCSKEYSLMHSMNEVAIYHTNTRLRWLIGKLFL